jgi:hypothetical protein
MAGNGRGAALIFPTFAPIMIRSVLLLSLCLLPFAASWGQKAASPFDLRHRLPLTTLLPADSSSDNSEASSPFDLVPHRPPGASRVLSENATEPFRPFSVMPRGGGLSNGMLFGVLMAMFMVLTLSVAANRGAVGKAWRGFLNDNALALAQREATGLVGSTPYYLLYLNFLLNAGLFIFLVTRFFKKETFNNLPFLLVCVLGGAALFLFKHLIISFLRYLFPIQAEMARYNFLMVIFNCVLGLFLVPFNFLIAFGGGGGEYQGLFVFWTLGLVAIFYAYRSLRAFNVGSKFLGTDLFHFLLYLCTVEIAPVLLLVKLARLQS